MRSTGRYAAACVVALGLASPLSASVYAPGKAAGDKLCAEQATDRACLAGVGLGTTALDGVAVSARPAGGAGAPAGAEIRAEPGSADNGFGEFAALLVADRSAAVTGSGDGAVPLLFWVFGTGLLGFAFVARRRKPSMERA